MDQSKQILISEKFESYKTIEPLGNTVFDKDTFLLNYGNIKSLVHHESLYVEVYEKENTIGIRLYHVSNRRWAGKRYFKVEKNSRFISYNYKTKNFYWGFSSGSRKRVNKNKLYCNSFYRSPYSIFSHELIETLKFSVLEPFYITESINSLVKEVKRAEDIISFYIEHLISRVNYDYDFNKLESNDSILFCYFLLENGIKFPDTIETYINQRFEKKKLKSFGNVVTYFMDEFELKGRKIRKLLSTFKNNLYYNTENLIYIYKAFGVDYFNKVNEDQLSISRYPIRYSIRNDVFRWYTGGEPNFTNQERSKMLSLFNHGVRIRDLVDHINIIKNVNMNGVEFKFKAKNPIQFRIEHEVVSEIYSNMRSYKVERIYDDNLISHIEQTLKTGSGNYYPKVLKTTTDYINESAIQRNCVRTYTITPTMIVSLRKYSVNSEERLTLEYQICDGSIKRVQSRSKFNGILDEYDETLCEYLDKKINKYIRSKDIELPSIVLKNDYMNKKIDSGINFFTKNLDWKEDVSIFDKGYRIDNIYEDELPF
jgi:hypothetical protein